MIYIDCGKGDFFFMLIFMYGRGKHYAKLEVEEGDRCVCKPANKTAVCGGVRRKASSSSIIE